MKKEKLEKLILILLLASGVVYAYIAYFFLPKWSEIQTDFQKLAERKLVYTAMQAYSNNQSDLQNKTKEIQGQVQALIAHVPVRLDKPQIMVDLYNLAKARGVYPQALTYDSYQNKGISQEMSLTFVSLGKPSDVLALLQDIQQSAKQSFAIQSTQLTSQKGLMRAEIKLTAYAVPSNLSAEAKKSDFMNSPLGVNSAAQLFTP